MTEGQAGEEGWERYTLLSQEESTGKGEEKNLKTSRVQSTFEYGREEFVRRSNNLATAHVFEYVFMEFDAVWIYE